LTRGGQRVSKVEGSIAPVYPGKDFGLIVDYNGMLASGKIVANALQCYSTRSLYVQPPSDNTASQNMFLNIFFVHLSIHRWTGGRR
jgi:hypothetical protein